MLFSFALEYAIRKVQETRLRLKWNGPCQLLAYTDDVNLLGDYIHTIKRNTETLIDASKEVGLKINIMKTKYMLLSRHQNVGQNRDMKIANRSFENVSHFKYLRKTVTNKNVIQEEIKTRLNSGKACFHSVRNLLSFPLQTKNVKIKIFKIYIIIIFCLWVCMGVKLSLWF
jgi:hypothetical protein